MIRTSIVVLLVGGVLIPACGTDTETSGAMGSGASGSGASSSTSGAGGAAPACGNLGKACADSEYCLVSKSFQLGSPEVIATSDCEPYPPSGCPSNPTMNDLCACLTEDAKAKNTNCTKLGVAYSCNAEVQGGVPQPGAELACTFKP